MGTITLTVCPGCSRHMRCDERACPFCGAHASSFWRVLEYRLKTQLSRGQAFSLGAALTAAGFVTSCDESVAPPYGIACTPMICPPIPASGGAAGSPVVGGSGGVSLGGKAGSGGNAGVGNAGSGGGPGPGPGGNGGQAMAGASDGGSMTSGAGGTTGGDGGSSGANADENAGQGGDGVAGGNR